jgi:hypothetical protein
LNNDLEQARRIAVALEQELARVRELAETLAQRWTDHAAFLGARTAHGPGDFAAQLSTERAHAYTVAARDLRWILANDSIPHDLMTDAELGEEEAS